MGRRGGAPAPHFLAHWRSKKVVQVVQNWGDGGGGVEVIWTKSKRTAPFFRETVPKPSNPKQPPSSVRGLSTRSWPTQYLCTCPRRTTFFFKVEDVIVAKWVTTYLTWDKTVKSDFIAECIEDITQVGSPLRRPHCLKRPAPTMSYMGSQVPNRLF